MTNSNLYTRGLMAAVALSLGAGLALAQSEVVRAQGIYIDGRSNKQSGKPGIKFDVVLAQDGQSRPVSVGYDFRSGDSMKFRMEVNRDSYVYILNRTFNGDPEAMASKGINRVRDEDQQQPPAADATYKLLFPVRGEGNRIAAGHTVVVPGRESFVMDDTPGVEKLYVVVSATPLNISRLFNTDGDLSRRGEGPSAGGRGDSDRDVLDQLNASLAQYAANSDTSLAGKGIVRESDSYGIVRDGDKPAQFEVNLRHLPR